MANIGLPAPLRLCWLGEDIGLAQELVPFFRARGVQVRVDPADHARGLGDADVALTYFSDPALAGAALCSTTQLRTITWPPLVAISSRAPAKADLERMRRQGVVHVCREVDGSFATIVSRLSDRASCGKGALSPGLLADLLLQAEASRASGLLCVSCPHWSGASRYPWESSSLFYCSDSDAKCTGWVGRIYLINGTIALAEVPSCTGVHALRAMLRLDAGELQRFPFFLSPEATESLGPAGQAVARARATEATTTARILAPLPPSPAKLGPIPPPSAEPHVTDLDAVLSSSSAFTGVVRVGADGAPLEAAGDIDAHGVAAVVHMAQDGLLAVAASLPLGGLLGFSVAGRQGSCFVRLHAKSRTALAVRAGASQTTNRTLADLARFG